VRRFARLLDGWGLMILFVGVGAVTAVFDRWSPWEIVALVAILGATGAVVAGVSAWQEIRTREIELAALTSDEQAARLLGEALGRCGPFLAERAVRDLWATFATLPSEEKRALALAIVGFIGDSESYALAGVGPKLLSIAQSFRATAEAP
jgi:hypothetical protein